MCGVCPREREKEIYWVTVTMSVWCSEAAVVLTVGYQLQVLEILILLHYVLVLHDIQCYTSYYKIVHDI